MNVLITGANGFLAQKLIPELRKAGHNCVLTDLYFDVSNVESNQIIRCDLSEPESIQKLAEVGTYDVIFHLAAQIDFAVKNQKSLYNNNVACAESVKEIAIMTGCKKIVYTSSNSIFLGNKNKMGITETEKPIPIDEYGKSKYQSEIIFKKHKDYFETIIIRCPNIVDSGRVGMLAILFDFISENKKCWAISNGKHRYQCIYAKDLVDACILSMRFDGSSTFNVGSESITSFKEMYEQLILSANSKSKIVSIPSWPTIPLLKILHRLKLSPLGPYQFNMLTSDFSFDTRKIKNQLNWKPTLNNCEMLILAFNYYMSEEFTTKSIGNQSANNSKISLGILSLLKYIS